MTRELVAAPVTGFMSACCGTPGAVGCPVSVDDTKTGNAFELPVPYARRALDIFHHPYAYAATCITR